MIRFGLRPKLVQSLNVQITSIAWRRSISGLTSFLSDTSNQLQIYKSNSSNPFVNLSIEHHLFRKSPPGSKILFTYVNRPCIVIGRNQNPWLEVNLALLRQQTLRSGHATQDIGKVDLVRRRSGGGTVFHDEGNVNWSVICDFTEFTRDKHAEMVVRALRSLGIPRARVNERHDIVLDQGVEGYPTDPKDTHVTPFTDEKIRPLKVSGSAYKMSGNRALHHGTALLNSPNLEAISQFLRSPARGHITAKGVESVSSPISNLGIENEEFVDAVQNHFTTMYGKGQDIAVRAVDDSALGVEEIRKGHDELTGLDWTYGQTPGFEYSSRSSDPDVDADGPKLDLSVKHGAIQSCEWTVASANAQAQTEALSMELESRKLHEIDDWKHLLRHISADEVDVVVTKLDQMLRVPR